MKSIIIGLVLLTLVIPAALAQGNGNVTPTLYGNGSDMVISPNPNAGQNASGDGTTNQQVTQNQGDETNLTVRERLMARVDNASQLRERIGDLEEEYGQEIQNYGQAKKLVFQNQNKIRVAVHALLGAENLTGGIGGQVSQIAREFNNSLKNTTSAEERIHARDWFSRFFFGGDEVAAADMEAELERNRDRLQNLTNLLEGCDCDQEVKAMLQEQVQNLQQEQERLRELAQQEKQSKGLFGWLWK
jgi:hypothetical protein